MFHTSKYHVDCDVCGTLTETKVEDIWLPRLGKKYLLQKAAIEVCPNCGERYIPAKTVEEFDKLAKENLVPA